jgi:hypothetical protein
VSARSFRVAFGVMPVGCRPSVLAYSFRCSLVLFFAFSSGWRRSEGSGSSDSCLNKCAAASGGADLAVVPPPFCRRGGGGRGYGRACFDLLSWCWASLDQSFWRWQWIWRRASGTDLETDDRAPVHIRRWFWKSYGSGLFRRPVDFSGRMAAKFVLPGLDARREAVLLQHGVCGVQLQRSCRTKWSVPGAGGDWFHREAVRTRSRFPVLFEVLFVRFRVLLVIFCSSEVLFVRCNPYLLE